MTDKEIIKYLLGVLERNLGKFKTEQIKEKLGLVD